MNHFAQGLKRCIRSFAHSQSTGLRIPTEITDIGTNQRFPKDDAIEVQSRPQARPLLASEIEYYGALLGRGFAEEGCFMAQLQPLDDERVRQKYLEVCCTGFVRGMLEHGAICQVVPQRGIILSADCSQTFLDVEAIWEVAGEAADAAIPEHWRQLIQERYTAMEQLLVLDWPTQLPQGFLHLAALAIDSAWRGRGTFGALVDPLCAEADARRLPIALEAFKDELVPVYGSRGFEVIERRHNTELDLTLNLMVRQPHQ
ncbi:MAG: hypothetical protein LBR39_05230 [Coriobacteriales bacterium]|jgi:GNAT superfamily N-acetyltransferase|nr:hypothetical protein [Coriobacteriales bacterium]